MSLVRWIAALVLGTVLAGLLPTGVATAAVLPSTSSGLKAGVQFKGMWSDYTDAQRIAVLDALAAAGVDEVRIDVSWAMLQPDGPGSYSDWGVGFVDRVISMAHARGLTPLMTLWLTPAWANGGAGERVLPTDPADYARAAAWAAKRWEREVGAWEIWNEPNSGDFMVGADPAAYARLLQATYPLVKAAVPSTTVVFGGTMYVDTDWIARAYAAGAGGSFDALAVHPYMGIADQAPETPGDGSRYTLDHVRVLHQLMTANGDGAKDIWLTEMGWSSHPTAAGAPNWQRGVTEAVQADYLVRALTHIERSYPYVSRAFWYTERNQVDSHVQDNNYGLLRRDLSPKPAYTAMAAYLLARRAGSLLTPVLEPVVSPVAPVVTAPVLRRTIGSRLAPHYLGPTPRRLWLSTRR